jgi:hypothetical protein
MAEQFESVSSLRAEFNMAPPSAPDLGASRPLTNQTMDNFATYLFNINLPLYAPHHPFDKFLGPSKTDYCIIPATSDTTANVRATTTNRPTPEATRPAPEIRFSSNGGCKSLECPLALH